MGRRKTSDFLSLEEIGRLAGGGDRSNHSLTRLAVFNAWSRAVGPTLRAVTRPSRHSGGRLVVEVGSAVWQKELERLRAAILDRLAALLPAGSVTSVSFALRPGLPLPPERIAGAAIEPIVADLMRVDPDAAEPASAPKEPAGRDEELRRRISDVARRYLKARV